MHKASIREYCLALFMVISVTLLSGCQFSETYSNPELGFTFKHPNNWELIEESHTEVGFYSKDAGDATILIRDAKEPSAVTAQASLQLQMKKWLEESSGEVSSISVSEVEHPLYDVAMAKIVYSHLRPFQLDFYFVVIQTTDRMVVLITGGDGTEPAKTAQTVIDSFEFLP